MEKQTIPLSVATRDGEFIAHYSERGLVGLNFPSKQSGQTGAPNVTPSARVRGWHRKTTAAIKDTLAGRAVKNLPPLDFTGGTEFQRAVWQALQEIPAGHTRSYGEIARLIGKPNAVRAVGGACGANPIPVLVPCHRVLAANHKLGGFSSGLDWKRKLLRREGLGVVSFALAANEPQPVE